MRQETEQSTSTPGARNDGKWLLGGGLAAAFAAALCCLGPLVFAGLGLGAFAAAGFFYELRPLFLGLAILLVTGAWIRDWRKRKHALRAGAARAGVCAGACERRSRVALILITIAAFLLAASPSILEAL